MCQIWSISKNLACEIVEQTVALIVCIILVTKKAEALMLTHSATHDLEWLGARVLGALWWAHRRTF